MKKIFSVLLVSILIFTSGGVLPNPYKNSNQNSIYSYAQQIKRGYFTGMTGTMNSINGMESREYTISSPTLPDENSRVTTVEANVTVSSKSSPFYLRITSPSGNTYQERVGRSGRIIFRDFENENPDGKWRVSIVQVMPSFNKPSTASSRLKINYEYVR